MGQRPRDIGAVLLKFRSAFPVALSSALLELLELLEGDKFQSTTLEIDFLITLACEQAERARTGVLDQKSARAAYWALFKELDEAGWGQLIVGRRGRQSRFRIFPHWAAPGKERGPWELMQLLREMKLPYFADGESAASSEQPRLPRPTRERIVQQLKAHRADVRKFGVASLALFGSVARDEAKADSDVDLLVAFKEPVTSDGFFGLKFFLEDLLGKRIDLVTEGALREPIRRAIEPELVNVA
ncbi:MAG: polymerase beta protein [Myxococcales bacterium]|nr:polymerase beta protein [Myxococcales bacterium]